MISTKIRSRISNLVLGLLLMLTIASVINIHSVMARFHGEGDAIHALAGWLISVALAAGLGLMAYVVSISSERNTLFLVLLCVFAVVSATLQTQIYGKKSPFLLSIVLGSLVPFLEAALALTDSALRKSLHTNAEDEAHLEAQLNDLLNVNAKLTAQVKGNEKHRGELEGQVEALRSELQEARRELETRQQGISPYPPQTAHTDPPSPSGEISNGTSPAGDLPKATKLQMLSSWLTENPDLANNELAEQLGVTPTTVRSYRRELGL